MTNQKPSSYITIFSTVLVLTILGMYGIIALHANNFADILRQNIKIVVELQDSLPTTNRDQIKTSLENHEKIRPQTIEFIPKSEAITFMEKELGGDFLMPLDQNPYKDIFTFKIKKEFVHTEDLQQLVNELNNQEGILQALYYGSVYEYLGKNVRRLSVILLILGLILAIFAFSLIYSTIYLSLYAERFKIRTMELVGSTKRQVHRPFLNKAVSMSIISSVLSYILLTIFILLLYWRVDLVHEILNIYYVLLVFVGIGLLCFSINFAATIIVLNKYLGAKKSALYQ